MGAHASLFSFSVLLSILSCLSHSATFRSIDLENPVIEVTSSSLAGYTSSSHGSKDVLLCERVRVASQSRLKLWSYSSAYQVTLAPSVVIPERQHSKILICFHQNGSRGPCQCEHDEWKGVRNGLWSSVMSPYADRYVDVKFVGDFSGSVTVTVKEEFQRWRLLCLVFGFILFPLASVVSDWVPFYYSSSMAIGVILVIVILLFQGMKILPTGRKSVFYLTVYGSVLGAGSFLLHHFTMLVNSVLANFGLGEEMHNPVSVFVLLLIVIAGAALGYWIVRKFVISEDGSVDVGIAQFVKWSMRVIAATFVFQSTLDTPLALVALGSCMAISSLFTSFECNGSDGITSFGNSLYPRSGTPWRRRNGRQFTSGHNHAEFLSKSGRLGQGGKLWKSPEGSPSWSDSPSRSTHFVKPGTVSPSMGRLIRNQQDHYSTFHKTPNRTKFSRKEWEKFTKESTRQSMAELASSPEFADWIIRSADRIQVLSDDDSSLEEVGSGSDSTDENFIQSCARFSFFKW